MYTLVSIIEEIIINNQRIFSIPSFDFVKECSHSTFNYSRKAFIDKNIQQMLKQLVWNKIINFLRSMNNLSSPFIQEIHSCKLEMRKLRKKIYKQSLASRGSGRRVRDSTEEILAIFQKRKLPEWVTQSLLKRRNFDLSSIKNFSMVPIVPLQEVFLRTDAQQRQVQYLYANHKQRNEKNMIIDAQLENHQENLHYLGLNSSTEEDEGNFSSDSSPPLQEPLNQNHQFEADSYSQIPVRYNGDLLQQNQLGFTELGGEIQFFNF